MSERVTCPTCGHRAPLQVLDHAFQEGTRICPRCRGVIPEAGRAAGGSRSALPDSLDVAPDQGLSMEEVFGGGGVDFRKTLEVRALRVPETSQDLEALGFGGQSPHLGSRVRGALRYVDPRTGTEETRIAKSTFLTIGREDCDVNLSDPSISRSHAVIVTFGDRFVLRDLGSTNGCTVNGRAVKVTELFDRDTIRLGDVDLTFRVGKVRPKARGGHKKRRRP